MIPEVQTITVDNLPSDFKCGDPITRLSHDEVVVRSDRYRIWVAKLVDDVLDAEVVG